MKETDLKAPVARLAEVVARNMDFSMQLRPDIQYGATDGTRGIVNMEMLLQRLAQPDGPKKFSARERYKIYDCLNIMPECVKSMEVTRGDKDGRIGTNRPLENTICVTVHHLDDKSYGGLCVLREWGATCMYNVFVGYNPLQNDIWRSIIDDIPPELFTACILASVSGKESQEDKQINPAWAEGIYEVVEKFNKFSEHQPLPSVEFNRIFKGENKKQSPLTFLEAQRSLCAYNFLMALARGVREQKKVFVWEDGGYLNPIIDEAIEEGLTVEQFREKYMVPADAKTDELLKGRFLALLKEYFIGSVELTRNGYDASAAIAEMRPMHTRLFSIAASYVKIMKEGDSITLACLDALSQVLYSTGCSLRNRNVLVLGARGNLGRLSIRHLANILAESKEQLWGCDVKLEWPRPEPDSLPEWAKGFASDVPLEDVAMEVSAYRELPEEVRYGIDVILGWTGGPRKDKGYQTLTGQDVAEWLTCGKKKNDLYLVSGSTKTVEYSDVLSWLEDILNEKGEERKINGILLDSLSAGPIPDQLSIAAVSQMWPGPNPPSQIKRNFGTQFVFEFKQDGVKVKKTVYLVNNTMPVNFMFYGTPTEIMDMTYSQVTSCAVALIKNQDIAPGIYPTDYKRSATEGVYDGIIPEKEYDVPPSV